MKTAKNITFYSLLLLCSLILLGCSQKSDENKPISEVKAEAEKMDINQLRSMAMKYKEAIAAKESEIEMLFARLKATKMQDTEAKKTTTELNKINQSMSALSERFQIYYNKLKEKGGDTSGLEI
jgi:uncharacterized lipoprotein YehR (DUF1307 family)